MDHFHVQVPLWQVVRDEEAACWRLLRLMPGGGMERLETTFTYKGAAKVLAATMNGELVANYRKVIAERWKEA